MDELTTEEVEALTVMVGKLLRESSCDRSLFVSGTLEGLGRKRLIEVFGSHVFMGKRAVHHIVGIVQRRLMVLTPEGKAQMLEDIMNGY